MKKYKLVCSDCENEYSPKDVEYLCPDCCSNDVPYLSGVLTVEYDLKSLRKKFLGSLAKNGANGHGKYIDILPIEKADSLPPLKIGPTPLEPVQRIRELRGLKNLFIKNDTLLPTGSFKDRASSIVVAKAIELKKKAVATASTGNAATALAGMSASVGLKNIIFVPASAPIAKLTQIAMFGATLVPVKGTYDDAFALCKEASKEYGWYNRNTGLNPYTIDGKKTAALEIWEQLGCKAPDKVFIPTGDGVILSGTYKGFKDLMGMGLIKKMPQIVSVQSEGSNAINQAFRDGLNYVPALDKASTIADSISVSNPACGKLALHFMNMWDGLGVDVSDQEILSAMKELASNSGIFAEPAAAAAYAGLIKAHEEGLVEKKDVIVVLITGTGLKDINAATKAVDIPDAIAPSLDALKEIL